MTFLGNRPPTLRVAAANCPQPCSSSLYTRGQQSSVGLSILLKMGTWQNQDLSPAHVSLQGGGVEPSRKV